MPKPIFPVEFIDQNMLWHDRKGNARFVIALPEDEVLWALDFLLANSRDIREAWSIKTHQEYDEGERSRRWMLNKPLVRGLMRRLIKIEDEKDE